MNAAEDILKRLERNTAAGAYLSQVFTDWLDLTHATLTALPAHLHSAATTGQLATDTPEAQAVFTRCRARYGTDWAWRNFREAFHILLDSTSGFWQTDAHPAGSYGWDVLGAVYMLAAYKKHSGQYFTPWNIAELMAHMSITNTAEGINERLRTARRKASARDDATSHLLAAAILTGLCVPPEEATTYFLTRILPLIAADFEPITICDPCCGSGVMLLAAARRFPAWAAQAGLVQLYGMDIDQTCVTMAQCNMLLYGLNGAGLHWALTASQAQIAALPPPYTDAYTEAQTAYTAGDTLTVEEIAATLRVQQALFDPTPFTSVPVRRQPADNEPKKKRSQPSLATLTKT